MKGVKGFLYILFGLIGVALAGTTLFLILIQYNIEINLTLTAFCVISWILFVFAAFQILNVEVESREMMWEIRLDKAENQQIENEE